MKVFVALCCLAVAQASLLPAAAITSKVISTGTSTQSRSQDAAGNYAFAYNEQHATGGSSRKEMGDAWNNVQGSYTLNVGDGRQRVVKYVADGAGFRAAISTNEPGTAAQAPADVAMSSPYLPPVAPVAVAEPLAIKAPLAYAEPLAMKAPLAYAEPLAMKAPLAYAEPLALKAPLAYAEPLAMKAPLAIAEPLGHYAVPMAKAIAYAPAVSSYSTSINHAAPAIAEPILAAKVVAGPVLAAPALALGKSGWY